MMAWLHPLTFVFILIIVYCLGWLSALWFMRGVTRREIERALKRK
jgi:hypothetical protein